MNTSAHDVAAMLIEEQHAAGRTIDKMQLQKLLYLVQGASVAFWGVLAFREPVLAYEHGPVVADVEASYRQASTAWEPLPRPLGGHPERLPAEVVDVVHTVLRHYGEWTGRNLERYVKRAGTPWRQVWPDLPDQTPSPEIPLDVIGDWFTSHGIEPAQRNAEPWEATSGEVTAADERIAEARARGAFNPAPPTTEVVRIVERSLQRIQSSNN